MEKLSIIWSISAVFTRHFNHFRCIPLPSLKCSRLFFWGGSFISQLILYCNNPNCQLWVYTERHSGYHQRESTVIGDKGNGQNGKCYCKGRYWMQREYITWAPTEYQNIKEVFLNELITNLRRWQGISQETMAPKTKTSGIWYLHVT